jgi:transcription termination factor Rho
MAAVQTFDLPAQATITEAGSILTSLRQLIEENQNIVVTCDRVEKSDLALFQVLISAGKTAGRDKKSFSVISNGNGTFDAALQEYGIRFSNAPDPI